MKIYNISLFFLVCVVIINQGCKKQDEFLDKKANLNDVMPTTIQDLQAILDNDQIMNVGGSPTAYLGTDEFMVSDANYLSTPTAFEKNAYIWKADILEGSNDDMGWSRWYQIIELSNIALDGLSKITPDISNKADHDLAKGCALFFRSHAMYHLVNTFAKAYDPATANTDLGIPIRTSSDINVKSIRSSVQACYNAIINDLKTAETLLPSTVPVVTSAFTQTRPSRIAVQALLSKAYLAMNDLINAGVYANKVLLQYSFLNNFGSYNATVYRPIPVIPGNPEVIFYSYSGLNYNISSANTKSIVDPELFNLYDPNDLRRLFFFRSDLGVERRFKGFPSSAGHFQGSTVSEMYLTRAEAYARQGSIDLAMADLNAVLAKRFITGTFTPITANTAASALSIILTERRKELTFFSIARWIDLRRLNLEGQFAKTLTRTVNGQVYSLPPNDKRYVYPIPSEEIRLSGLQQNER